MFKLKHKVQGEELQHNDLNECVEVVDYDE